MSVLTHSEVFGRSIRKGDWNDQIVSTYQKIQNAIKDGDKDDAKEYIEYFDVEAAVCYKLYAQWHADAERYLLEKGMTPEDLQGTCDDLKVLVNCWYEDGVPYDRDLELKEYRRLKARLLRELNAPSQTALRTLEEWKEQWRKLHDLDVDYVCGLFNAVQTHHGETGLEEMYRDYVIGDLFTFRYERFDVSKNDWKDVIDSLIYVSIEAMRGHLVGPERDGTMDFRDYDDRVELEFHPCASGGRSMAGDHISGTPSRHEAPYYYAPVQQKHDFSWNKTGVCNYCIHCAILMEKMPMEKFGYPVRVVDAPVYPENKTGRCKWTLYKDPRSVPESAYERMGEKKPAADEPLGSATRSADTDNEDKRGDQTRFL